MYTLAPININDFRAYSFLIIGSVSVYILLRLYLSGLQSVLDNLGIEQIRIYFFIMGWHFFLVQDHCPCFGMKIQKRMTTQKRTLNYSHLCAKCHKIPLGCCAGNDTYVSKQLEKCQLFDWTHKSSGSPSWMYFARRIPRCAKLYFGKIPTSYQQT